MNNIIYIIRSDESTEYLKSSRYKPLNKYAHFDNYYTIDVNNKTFKSLNSRIFKSLSELEDLICYDRDQSINEILK